MRVLATFFAAALLMTGCHGNTADPSLDELQTVRAGDLNVVLLTTDGALTHGKDALTVEFRRVQGGGLVDVGTVKAAATMPMAGLPTMLGSIFVEPTDTPGRYIADTDLGMSGGWDLKLEWDGPAGRGSAAFAATVE